MQLPQEDFLSGGDRRWLCALFASFGPLEEVVAREGGRCRKEEDGYLDLLAGEPLLPDSLSSDSVPE